MFVPYGGPPSNDDIATGTANGVTFAYKANQIIVTPQAFRRMKQLLGPGKWRVADGDSDENLLVVLDNVNVLRLAATLKAEDHLAQPNYALFAQGFPHPSGRMRPSAGSASAADASATPEAGQPNPFYANAAQANPFWANPFYANAGQANPFWANPFYANAGQANPFWANPFYANAGQANPFWANPFYANAGQANPFWANPFWANPFYANAGQANPFWANPFYANAGQANPFWANQEPPPCPAPIPVAWVCPPPPFPCPCQVCRCGSGLPHGPEREVALGEFGQITQPPEPGSGSARPAPAPRRFLSNVQRKGPLVIVLDTGLAASQYLPPLLADLDALTLDGDRDFPSEDLDPWLDPFAGHGTFVAGVIEQHAPRMNLRVGRVLNTSGATFQWSLTQKLETLLSDGIGPDSDKLAIDDHTIINFSLSGFAPEELEFLKDKIKKVQDKGAVVVAAAGNSNSDQETYPAALPGVIGVGALDSNGGRALFSNYGPWVRACAPGVQIISSFFTGFNGPAPAVGGVDPDDFQGWACWSGTSFAAPAVAAALANEMVRSKCDAQQAVRNLVDAGQHKVPKMGTKITP